MRTPLLLLSLVSLLLPLAACEEVPRDADGDLVVSFPDDFQSSLPPEQRAKVLARVDGEPITVVDFERRIQSQPPYARARYVGSPERQQEFLDNMVRFEVLAAEAQARGYHRHPEVVQAMKQTMVRKMMALEVQDRVQLSDVTEAGMKAYYDEHAGDYHKPEQVRVSHILVPTQEEAVAIIAELKTAIAGDERSYRKVFARIARERSKDEESRARGGDLRFFARTEKGGPQPKALSDAAFALERPGTLAEQPVQTEAGFHVLLLTGRKKRYDRTFEQVKRQIQNRLFRQLKRKRTEEFVDSLHAKMKPWRSPDAAALMAGIQLEPAKAAAPVPVVPARAAPGAKPAPPAVKPAAPAVKPAAPTAKP